MLNQAAIEAIFKRLQSNNPAPKIELWYDSPYTLLVAVILSAQATDISVNKITQQLFAVADTPEKMVALGEEQLKSYIRSIGLFNAKAANIIAMSALLIEKFNSIIPNSLEELQMLPGVGRKSANVILNSIFHKPTIAVDTHVFRVSNRIGLCKTTTPLTTERALLQKIPKEFMSHAHHWLVLHGRYVCKARKPLCKSCLIYDFCQYDKKTEK